MYNHTLKAGDCYYADTQTVPQNDSADGNKGALKLSGTNGGIEVVAVVTTALALADTKVFSIVLHESSDNAVSDAYTAIQTIYTVTAAGATAVVAGTELGRFLLPTDTEKYTKVVLTSDDAAMTGAVSVYARYVGR